MTYLPNRWSHESGQNDETVGVAADLNLAVLGKLFRGAPPAMQAVPVEVQLGALDATKIRDSQSYNFHSLACLFVWETPIYLTNLTTMKMVQIGHAMHLECFEPFFGAT